MAPFGSHAVAQDDRHLAGHVAQLEQAAAGFPESMFVFLHVDASYTGSVVQCRMARP